MLDRTNPSDRFVYMVVAQHTQQEQMIGSVPQDEAERARIGLELAAGLSAEVVGYTRALGYTTLLPDARTAGDRRQHRKAEIVDILKYALSLAHLDGFGAQELFEAFVAKTGVVYERMRAELTQTRIAGFDIDGVLACFDYPELGDRWDDESEARWVALGKVRTCALLPEARDFLLELRARGWGIVLVTARKRHKHPNMEADTYAWLQENGLPYDRVIFAYDKAQAIADARIPLRFFVEDSAKHALDIASAGIQVYHLGSDELDHPLITNHSGLASVRRLVWARDKKEDYAQGRLR